MRFLLVVAGCLVIAACEPAYEPELQGTESALRDTIGSTRTLDDLSAQMIGPLSTADRIAAVAYGRDLVAFWDSTRLCAQRRDWGLSVLGRGGPCPNWEADRAQLQGRNGDAEVRRLGLRCSMNDLHLVAVLEATRQEGPNDATEIAQIAGQFEECRARLR